MRITLFHVISISVFIFFLPNVCSQTRRGEAPELSVMHWIGSFFILEGGRVINEMDAIVVGKRGLTNKRADTEITDLCNLHSV